MLWWLSVHKYDLSVPPNVHPQLKFAMANLKNIVPHGKKRVHGSNMIGNYLNMDKD